MPRCFAGRSGWASHLGPDLKKGPLLPAAWGDQVGRPGAELQAWAVLRTQPPSADGSMMHVRPIQACRAGGGARAQETHGRKGRWLLQPLLQQSIN